MEQIFNEIKAERQRQDAKWGVQNHSPIEWVAILGEEFGEVSKAALENHYGLDLRAKLDNYREELIQVAAVAVAMIESLESNEFSEKPTDVCPCGANLPVFAFGHCFNCLEKII